MIVPLVKIIENLVSGDKAKAIAYSELLVKNTKRNYDLFGGITHHTDMITARNVLHTLKGEPKEGGVAVCDRKELIMTDAKNALAELAERLDIIVSGLVIDGHPCDETIDIRKAQRIVAELAKVRDTNWLAGHNYPEPNSSSVAVSNCRVIAEEGVKDGK